MSLNWMLNGSLMRSISLLGQGLERELMPKCTRENIKTRLLPLKLFIKEKLQREARFAREVAMLSRVQHKNLVKFIGACKEPVMVIVTELLSGGTLRKYLLNMRPRCLDLRVAIGFALDIAHAMECLHSHGVIHRDLKPDNLLLTVDHKTVKLADFGLAREESLTEMMTAETGTYRWMAPEHCYINAYNHKVDAYSFAIVLWELLHNRLPFQGMSNLQAAYAAAFKNVRPSADNLPEELAIILNSCWKEDPNDRPNFSQTIQMLLHYLATIAPPNPAIPPRVFTSDNTMLPLESLGTNTLMAVRDEFGETTKAKMENQPKGFFFCFSYCY